MQVLSHGPDPVLVGTLLPLLQKGEWQKIVDPTLPWIDLIGSTLGELAVECLKQAPAERPSSVELVEELQKLEWAAGAQASFQLAAAAGLGEPQRVDGTSNLCECVVCMEALPNARLRTCGHAVTCAECAAMLVDQGFGCPLCRRSIEAGDWDIGHFYPTFSRCEQDASNSDDEKPLPGLPTESESVQTMFLTPRKPRASLVGLLPSLLELMTLDSHQLEALPFRAALDLPHDDMPPLPARPTTEATDEAGTGCHEQVVFENLRFVWQCLLGTYDGNTGVNSKLVPRLVEIVRSSTEPRLQSFCAWTLFRVLPCQMDDVDRDAIALFTELASASDHDVQLVACWLIEAVAEQPDAKQNIVKCDGIALLSGLLESPSAALQESAIGALVNLSVDGEAFFGEIIAHAIGRVIDLLGVGVPQVRAKAAGLLRRLSLSDLAWKKQLCERGAVLALEGLIDNLTATTQEGRIEAASALLNLTSDEPSAASSAPLTSSTCLQSSAVSFARHFAFLVGIVLFVAAVWTTLA
jgi:hypothetical protein